MAYIIDQVNLLKDDNLKQASLLIRNQRIEMLRPSLEKFSYMRFFAHSYLMTPSHIVFNPKFPKDRSFQGMKQFFTNQFIKKGSTMFLTYAEVDKEYLLRVSIKNLKKMLLNSPVDFVIGVKVPLRLVTPSFIRKCKMEKVPAIFVEIEDSRQLERVPWGWIREALFPYNSPFVPIFLQEKPRERKRAQAIWNAKLKREKIPFVKEELQENEPVPLPVLCKIGIYPVKAGIHQGGEVTYNLYMNEGIDSSRESDLFHRDDKLLVTVHKGTVIRANEEVLFRPGYGQHVMIKTPSFFTKEYDNASFVYNR